MHQLGRSPGGAGPSQVHAAPTSGQGRRADASEIGLFAAIVLLHVGFYGAGALLALHLVRSLGWSGGEAAAAHAAFFGLAFLAPVAGGIANDRGLSLRIARVAGGCLLAAGFAAIAAGLPVAAGLALAAGGFGLTVPVLTAQASAIDRHRSKRGRLAVARYYVAVNAGAALAPFVCGTVGEKVGFAEGFAVAAAFCLASAAVLLLVRSPGGAAFPHRSTRAGAHLLSDLFGGARKLALLLTLLVLMRSAYQQSWSTVPLWTSADPTSEVPGAGLPTTWLLAINPILIVAFTAPLSRWRRSRQCLSDEVSMSIGAVLIGAGFAVLSVAAGRELAGAASLWAAATFFALLSGWEILLFPVALSRIGRVALSGSSVAVVGLWSATSFLGSVGGGLLGSRWDRTFPAMFFGGLALACGLGAVGLLLRRLGAPASEPAPGSIGTDR